MYPTNPKQLFLALLFASVAVLVACSGGSKTLPGNPGSNPAAAAPTPTFSAVINGVVPAPTGSDLANVLAGGNALGQYIENLAAALPTATPPPLSSIGISGTIQSIGSNSMVIVTTTPVPSPAPYFSKTNVSVASTVTVSFTSSTAIDSPNGMASFAVGTEVIAAGQLSSASAMDATLLVALGTPPLPQAGTQASAALLTPSTSARRRSLSTQDSENVSFTNTSGIPGVNATWVDGPIAIGKCTSVTLNLNAVAGYGIQESWPMTIEASETAAIPDNSTGTVTLNAISTAPPTPPANTSGVANSNFQFSDGLVADISGTLTATCGALGNGNSPTQNITAVYGLPDVSWGAGIGLNAGVAAPFGQTTTILRGQIGNVQAATANTTCAGPSKWFGLVGVDVCPAVSLSQADVSGTVTAANATIVTLPAALAPTTTMAVQPAANVTSYSLQMATPQFQYTMQTGLIPVLLLAFQPLPGPILYNTLPSNDTMTGNSIAWQLDATPSSAGSSYSYQCQVSISTLLNAIYGQQPGTTSCTPPGPYTTGVIPVSELGLSMAPKSYCTAQSIPDPGCSQYVVQYSNFSGVTPPLTFNPTYNASFWTNLPPGSGSVTLRQNYQSCSSTQTQFGTLVSINATNNGTVFGFQDTSTSGADTGDCVGEIDDANGKPVTLVYLQY